MTLELKAAGSAPAQDITRLIENLGSADFNVRQAAQQEIEAMGPTVLPQMEKSGPERRR